MNSVLYCFKQGVLLAAILACLQPALAAEKGNPMNIHLQASVEPDIWPEKEMQDVIIRLTLKNTSEQPISIYPDYTALSWKTSVASMGMSWNLNFIPAGQQAKPSGHELRTYYGPPGEPVSEQAIKKAGMKLKPGQEKQFTLPACWIPRALLNPANLSVKMLDPDGYDNLKSIPQIEQSSVLVFHASSAVLEKEMKTKQDFLRGYMVVFFHGSGKYNLHAAYRQSPIMCKIVQEVNAEAKAVEIRVGE